MKKSLFFVAAASALMLTACSSESDVLQSATQPQTTVQQQAVGFDVYTPAATNVRRAGYNEGSMNTTRLQMPNVGFGLYGFYTDQTDGTAQTYAHTTGSGTTNDYIPNFMWNEHVSWNDINKGWYYSPLKYWPNETQQDSQTGPAIMDGTNSLLDKLTFFAYAPYVDPSSSLGSEGITAITANTGILTPETGSALAKTDPLVEYKTAADVNNGVDLLWGVAPAGNFSYTAVNKSTITIGAGKPYIDLVKPDVNTSLKFFFEHALARFGITVAAAIDQIPQGGALDASTRVNIEQVKLTGYFGTTGILNLNNNAHPNVANWVRVQSKDLSSSITTLGGLDKTTITIGNTNIAQKLQFTAPSAGKPSAQVNTGVTHEKSDLLKARYVQVDKPTSYDPTKKYYDHAGNEIYANCTANFYFMDGNDYKKLTSSKDYSTSTTYYTLTATAVTAGTASDKVYKLTGDNYIYCYPSGTTITSAMVTSGDYFTLASSVASVAVSNFSYADGDYYQPKERSFYMVIPTNNIQYATGITGTDNLKKLHTIDVEITYYVTTEDGKLADARSQVKNVIKKTVELPSLANGQSYNLNLILGLTSVKVEAEVGDWKEEYVQVDLPQNTAGD